jgi:hypothetical protein
MDIIIMIIIIIIQRAVVATTRLHTRALSFPAGKNP